QALVAGGLNTSGAVLTSASILSSSPTTITTDNLDYRPGETVIFSGRGWQPGEIVKIMIHEDPHTPQERGIQVQADADGNLTGHDANGNPTGYVVQDYDLNMKFIVGAKGQSSGWTAQTTFTDAVSINSATLTIKNSGCTAAQSAFNRGDTVCASVALSTNGN